MSDDVTGYEGLGAAEAWARFCKKTGVKARTEKVGSAFDWTDFAVLAEATAGIALHERAKLHIAAKQLADDWNVVRGFMVTGNWKGVRSDEQAALDRFIDRMDAVEAGRGADK